MIVTATEMLIIIVSIMPGLKISLSAYITVCIYHDVIVESYLVTYIFTIYYQIQVGLPETSSVSELASSALLMFICTVGVLKGLDPN